MRSFVGAIDWIHLIRQLYSEESAQHFFCHGERIIFVPLGLPLTLTLLLFRRRALVLHEIICLVHNIGFVSIINAAAAAVDEDVPLYLLILARSPPSIAGWTDGGWRGRVFRNATQKTTPQSLVPIRSCSRCYAYTLWGRHWQRVVSLIDWGNTRVSICCLHSVFVDP